jgi:hypothetical protein
MGLVHPMDGPPGAARGGGAPVGRTSPVKPGEARGSRGLLAGVILHFCEMGRCSIDQATKSETE